MIDYRPCGACGELVPAPGCGHWRAKEADLVIVDLTPGLTAEQKARENARRAVAEFRRSMRKR